MALESGGVGAVDRFRALCEEEGAAIPLFCQAWWLDALAGEVGWDVALVEKGGVIHAAMPFVIRKQLGFDFITQPPLTQHLGPWIRPVDAKSTSKLSREKELMEGLIERLPAFGRFFQNWSSEVMNWLPFYWRGYQQTTRYTYVLRDLQDENKLWSGLRENIKGDIKKSEKRFSLKVRTDLDANYFFKLNSMVFARKGMKSPYNEVLLRRLDSACKARGARRIFIAEDADGRHHAGIYLVWDENAAYYLMGGGDPSLRNSGATSLCLWEAIKFSATVSRRFDFEGSMLEPVERFFRAFGAEQVPYHSLSKTNSIFLKFVILIKGLKEGR